MNEACLDCHHSKEHDPGNYCYMFKTAPANLPCGQHDKFKERRDQMGKIIRKHPWILAQMIRGMGGHL